MVILGLVGFAMYNLYNDKKNKENDAVAQNIEKKEETKIPDIRVGIVGFDTINPILSNNKNVQDLSKIIFDSLLTINEEHKIQNNIVKEYSLIGEKDFLIKLTEGIKWHNGEELTASDVKFTIDIIKDPNINSIYKESLKDVIGVEVIDKYTIRINLSRRVPFFEYNLIFPIMSGKYYEGEDFVNTSKNRNPVGTGMFNVSSADNGDIVLKKNQTWWNEEIKNPYIETIHIKMYGNMGEAYNAFKTNNIDFVTTNNINWKEHVGTIGYNVKEYSGREYDFLMFNLNDSILSRKEVRQAIALGIDKNKINANVYNNQYIISNSLLDYGNWLYDQNIKTNLYNVELARQTLVDAGWEYKNNSWQKIENYKTIRLRITLTVDTARNVVAQNIKEDLEKIGIEVIVKQLNDAQYYKNLTEKNFEIILTGKILSLSPDLTGFLGEGNLANYNNQEVVNILNEINGINNEVILKEKYKRLLEIANDELPYVYLYYNKSVLAYSYYLSGNVNPNWYNIFYNINAWSRQK